MISCSACYHLMQDHGDEGCSVCQCMINPNKLANPEVVSVVTEGHIIVDERRAVYGDAIPTYTRIAQVWSGILDHEVQPHEVALCMAGLKAVRTAVCPNYSDNSDDIDGYIKLFREIVGPDMVHARSVEEYVKQRRSR